MSKSPGIAEQYLFAVESFVDFARTLDEATWGATVPCTPDWTARDVLSHVAGIPDDALAGRMEGAPGEAWTAAQIERNRPFGVDDLLDRWGRQAPGFAEMIEQIGQYRPPIDCHSHEHDIRQMLGAPGSRSNVIVDLALFAALDVPISVAIELDDATTVTTGDSDADTAVTLRGATRFELFRSRLGRRSLEQVRSYDWVGSEADIDAVIDAWFSFGPSPLPIVE